MQISYRRDIDGLRAIAVGGVVLYHAGWTAIPGGFVGVDIFFVISGYLISAGLFSDAGTRGLSIARFYERRIRRILPAYAAVILASLVAGVMLLLPSELVALSKSAVAATLFAANIHFWTGAGYFAGNPLSHPLLHLWSLAVEEQFYIVWPLLVAALYRLGLQRWRVPLIVAGIVATLALSEAMLGYSAKTAFYMAPLRAWELLIGALLACRPTITLARSWMAHAIGAVAAMLMLAPMLLLSEASRFPGLSAAPPCLGAALVILHDPRRPSFLSSLLSLRLPVYLGIISYSLYMWHWPVLSFVWYVRGGLPDGIQAIALVSVIIAIAALSWRFIEQPFRRRPLDTGATKQSAPRATTRQTLVIGGAVLSLLLLVTAGFVALRGLPQRLPPAAARLDAQPREPYETHNGCVFTDTVPVDAGQRCFATADRQPGPKIVLWGDSFAAQHIKTIEGRFATPQRQVVSIIATGCSPLPGTTQYFGKGRADTRCGRMNAAIFEQLRHRADVEAVIIGGRWSNLYGLDAPGAARDPTARFLTDAGHPEHSLSTSLNVMEASLDHTVTALRQRGIAVTLLREPPRFAQDVQPCIARALWHGQSPDRCAVTTEAQERFRGPVSAVLARIGERHPDILVYDPGTMMCHNGICRGYADQILLTRDSEHLTRTGSQLALTGLRLRQ
jgi:peptidoglycan/LPS O-acetylase OafA/YrhL